MSPTLQGHIALVTGASRGAGRAIALALGEAGATVYVTGRSRRGHGTTENMPGTVEDTADEVTARGGQGIAVGCDHTHDEQVRALFDRIQSEQKRLDLLVNNAWGGYEQYELQGFMAPFWKQPFEKRWTGMFEAGVRAHLFAARLGVELMLPHKRGLILSTIAWDRGLYLGNLYYDLAKNCLVRAAADMAFELKAHGISALALAPGFMRTERVMAAHAEHPFDLSRTESPTYLGRAVVALASDPKVARWSGQALSVGDLAPEYGFTDEDGSQPPPFRMDQQ